MTHLISFSKYQTKCFIKFLFRQLMTWQTSRFSLDQPLKQWLTGIKGGEDENAKTEYLKSENSFLGEIKSIVHNF